MKPALTTQLVDQLGRSRLIPAQVMLDPVLSRSVGSSTYREHITACRLELAVEGKHVLGSAFCCSLVSTRRRCGPHDPCFARRGDGWHRPRHRNPPRPFRGSGTIVVSPACLFGPHTIGVVSDPNKKNKRRLPLSFRIAFFTTALVADLSHTIFRAPTQGQDAEIKILYHTCGKPVSILIRNQYCNFRQHGWRRGPYLVVQLLSVRRRELTPARPLGHQAPGRRLSLRSERTCRACRGHAGDALRMSAPRGRCRVRPVSEAGSCRIFTSNLSASSRIHALSAPWQDATDYCRFSHALFPTCFGGCSVRLDTRRAQAKNTPPPRQRTGPSTGGTGVRDPAPSDRSNAPTATSG